MILTRFCTNVPERKISIEFVDGQNYLERLKMAAFRNILRTIYLNNVNIFKKTDLTKQKLVKSKIIPPNYYQLAHRFLKNDPNCLKKSFSRS